MQSTEAKHILAKLPPGHACVDACKDGHVIDKYTTKQLACIICGDPAELGTRYCSGDGGCTNQKAHN